MLSCGAKSPGCVLQIFAMAGLTHNLHLEQDNSLPQSCLCRTQSELHRDFFSKQQQKAWLSDGHGRMHSRPCQAARAITAATMIYLITSPAGATLKRA